jgi:hypothetical protein
MPPWLARPLRACPCRALEPADARPPCPCVTRQVAKRTFLHRAGHWPGNVLGIWAAPTEDAALRLSILTELKRRGVEDIFFACSDGAQRALQGCKPRSRPRSRRHASCTSSALLRFVSWHTARMWLRRSRCPSWREARRKCPTGIPTFRGRCEHSCRFFVPAGDPAYALHDERGRVAELPASQGAPQPRPLLERGHVRFSRSRSPRGIGMPTRTGTACCLSWISFSNDIWLRESDPSEDSTRSEAKVPRAAAGEGNRGRVRPATFWGMVEASPTTTLRSESAARRPSWSRVSVRQAA